jgi:DNA-binding MarR family transcriptional regulator
MIGGVDLSDNAVLTKELTRYYSIWQEINYIYDKWAKSNGISVSYLLVLAAIDEAQDECTQKKISQRYMLPKQTVNAALKDLEQKGYVVLHPMLKDKRNKQISFTKIGQAYADSILNELRSVELFAIEKIGSERMRRFNDDGELFIKFLSEAGDKN